MARERGAWVVLAASTLLCIRKKRGNWEAPTPWSRETGT
jgi:hypothetical protein